MTESLRYHLKDKKCLEVAMVDPNGKYGKKILPEYQLVRHKFPITCLDIICRGKQIFFMMDSDICMFGGLGMEGKWFYFDDPEKLKDYTEQRTQIYYPKFCLSFGVQVTQDDKIYNLPQSIAWHDDKRNFSNFTIGTWVQGFEKMKEIGPDLLATTVPFTNLNPLVEQQLPPFFFEKVTEDRFRSEITRSTRSQMNICKFLMEQKYFASIGNYLNTECLYRAGISPLRDLGTLTLGDIRNLHLTVLHTIQAAYQCKGLTHGTFLSPTMEKGTFEVYVYKKEGQIDRNGYQIQKIKGGHGRSVFYVPQIQV